MVDGNQTASGGILLTEKAHPEINVSDLGDQQKRVRFLEKWTIYKETALDSQVGGQTCTPTALKRCIPKAAIEGAIIAQAFKRRGDDAEEVSYENLTETEIKAWLVPKATASDLINKDRIERATNSVQWTFDEKFSKASELLASDFATKLSDIGLKQLFSKQKKDIHKCLIDIIVRKIAYIPLRETMLEQMEISEKVRKTWAGFLSSLYEKSMGLDVGGTWNEKVSSHMGRTLEPKSPRKDTAEGQVFLPSKRKNGTDACTIPFESNRFTASNQDDMYRDAIENAKRSSTVFTPQCPVDECKRAGKQHWLRDCPTKPNREEQTSLLNELEKKRHHRREIKRLKRLE